LSAIAERNLLAEAERRVEYASTAVSEGAPDRAAAQLLAVRQILAALRAELGRER